jgi:hypothetical protein
MTPCYTCYIHGNTYVNVSSISVPKLKDNSLSEFWGHNTSSYCGLGSFFVLKTLVKNTRTHLTRSCCLNEFLSPDFGYCTDSYVLIQYVSKIYVPLIRSTYVLYNNEYLHRYFMTILPCRNCTSFYKSDEIVRFSALVGILEIYKKFNILVKNYI